MNATATLPDGMQIPNCHKHDRRKPVPMDEISFAYSNGIVTKVFFSCPRCWRIVGKPVGGDQLGEQLTLDVEGS